MGKIKKTFYSICLFIVPLLIFLPACSIKKFAMNQMAKALTNQTSSTMLSGEDFDLSGKVVRLSGDIEGLGIVKTYEKGVFISIVSLTGEEERQIRLVGRYKIVVLASNKNEYTELSARNAIVEKIVEEIPLSISQEMPPTGQAAAKSWPSSFIGVVFPYNGFNAKYTRSSQALEGTATLPGGLGIGVVLGDSSRVFGFEFSYTRSSAEVAFSTFTNLEVKEKATWNMLNLDIKLHLIPNPPIRPYLLAGVGYFWLTPENEHLFGQTPLWDGAFGVLGLDLGGGLEFRPARAFSIAGTIVYRLFDGTTIWATGASPMFSYRMWGNGLNFTASARIHF